MLGNSKKGRINLVFISCSKLLIKNKKLKNRISSKKLQHEVAKSHKKEINDDNIISNSFKKGIRT